MHIHDCTITSTLIFYYFLADLAVGYDGTCDVGQIVKFFFKNIVQFTILVHK